LRRATTTRSNGCDTSQKPVTTKSEFNKTKTKERKKRKKRTEQKRENRKERKEQNRKEKEHSQRVKQKQKKTNPFQILHPSHSSYFV